MDREEIDRRLAEALERDDWTTACECHRALFDLDRDLGHLGEVARLSREKLGDLSAAEAAWRLILDIDPNHARALWELQALYSEMQRWADYVLVGERRVALTEEPAIAAELLRDLARVYR